jgi:hypothetical protein
MQNFYLLNYIQEISDIDDELLDSLRFELDQNIYHYGAQFRHPKENRNPVRKLYDAHFYWDQLKYIHVLYRSLLHKQLPKNDHSLNIISNAYFSTNDELRKLGFEVCCPLWNISYEETLVADWDCFKACTSVKKSILGSNFKDIIDSKFLEKIKQLKNILREYFIKHRISALIVPNDISFFENLSIRIFKEIHRPSFLFLHGLPGRYNIVDDNRADYLVVWGEKIKDQYVKSGFDSKKIFISGHPFYKTPADRNLRFSLESILIITKGMNGAQHSDGVRLGDRGNMILYLYIVESVLKRMGVKNVRLRLHPSENSNWYFRFLDNEFYKIDDEDLGTSLSRSTLVIGPTSTVFLEALYYGVNYVCFEPSIEDIDLLNFPLVPPFDGSDERVPVARNEEELENIIKSNVLVNLEVFDDYIKTPFDLSFIKTMI